MSVVESRTAKSLKNAKIAVVFYFINLILQFFSRKIFLEYLGAEVLGLNTTAQNLLGFLNLAELGIGSAIAYTLYKPLYRKDIQTINEIVSVQGWLYRKVAYVVVAGACLLMCFFPLIFEKAEVPLWYTYASFFVLLVGALLSYFINYRQIVLTADQKEYKITLNVQGFKVLKVVLQILAIYYLLNGYVYWMALELLFSVTATLVLNRVLRREYPWLKSTPKQGKELKKKYPEIIIKTKQIFFHQIAIFVLTQTSPLIIYAYSSLTLVANYGNYMLIITGATLLMNSLLNSVSAGIGNLVAEGDKKNIKSVFWELTSLRIWLASIICYGIYKLGDSFIILWLGKDFVIEQSAFHLLILIAFINLTRTNSVFLAAYGLFHDIWAPLIEAVLNLGLSIILGYFYGLRGILLGVAISLLLVVYCWKPYFLYSRGFKENIWEYVKRYIKYISILAVSFTVTSYLINNLFSDLISSYWEWGIFAFKLLLLYVSISLLLFLCVDSGLRSCIRRIKLLGL